MILYIDIHLNNTTKYLYATYTDFNKHDKYLNH